MKSTLMLALLCGLAAATHAAGEENGARETMEAPAIPTGFINKTLGPEAATRKYVVYVPREYDGKEDWPLILFLHGAGERGDDGLLQTEVGLANALRRFPERYPAVALFPQCPAERVWTSVQPELETMLQRTQAEYRIDPARVYLTGSSMGGYGTWIWGAAHTDLFAALMPVCGGGSQLDLAGLSSVSPEKNLGSLKERIERLATVPIWAFHGADDEVVPPARSRQMVEAVREAGGEVKYTEFPDTGHDSWTPAYQLPEAAEWLFQQRK